MKQKIKQLVRWVIFAIFLILLARYILIHWEDFSFLRSLDSINLIPAILTSLALPLLYSYRYFLIIDKIYKPVRFIQVFKFQIFGRFLNRIAPQSGMVYKAHAFGKNLNLGYGAYFSSLISFTYMDLLITIITCTILIGVYHPELILGRLKILEILIIVSVVLLSSTVIAFAIFKNIPTNTPSRLNFIKDLVNRMVLHIKGCFELVKNVRLLTLVSLILFVEYYVSTIRLYFCFKLIGFSPEFFNLLVFMILGRLSNIIIIAPGNLGLREFLYGYLSDWIKAGMSEGIFISIILRAVEFIILGFMVCVFTILTRSNFNKVLTWFKDD